MMDKSCFYTNGRLNKNKLKEDWVKKNINEYPSILEFGKNINYLKFSQLLYHYVNSIAENIICKNCNSENQNFIGFDIGYSDGCSRTCNIKLTRPKSNETRKKNTIDKFGVDHTSKLESVKMKIRQTNIDRYGGVAPSTNIDILNKMKSTNLERYGVEMPLQSNEIYKKYQETCFEKYGVDNFSKTGEFLEKIKRNGVYRITTDEVKDKIRKKVNDRNFDYLKSRYDIEGYTFIDYSSNFLKIKCHKCNEIFEITANLAYQRVYKNDIELCTIHNVINNKQSNSEREIIEYLKSIGVENIDFSNRTILGNGFEIDIYLPDYKIGIEFNGIYWHSDKYKDRNYHRNKYLLAKDKGIHLVQIWEDYWLHKGDIIKSILSNKFGRYERISARKCQIIEVNMIDTKKFLNENHIQGWCVSKFNFGLYLNGELISIMTFGKMRSNLGNKNIRDDEYELLRFCNKMGKSVIGGSSRLFKHFIKTKSPSKITSFSENDLFSGEVYIKLGMTFTGETGSNFYWSDGYNRKNRWRYRKIKLIEEGSDPNKTADQIMMERGFFKCWNSGNKKYIWINSNYDL